MSTPPKIGPDTISPERAPSLGVALRFFVMGLLYLAVLLVTAILRAPMLALDFLHNPVTLGVTHLFTLGFAGSVVLGAIYQMVPVLLYSYLYSERLANLHLGIHGVGAGLMVAGFMGSETAWVITGGTLVTVGAAFFLWNLINTLRKAERWNWHGAFMGAAMLSFIGTLSWGLVMAVNQRTGFMGEVEGAPLAAHLVLGLLGWFSLMIVGVGLKLIPMFAPSKSLPPRIVAAIGAGTAGGVVISLIGLIGGWTALAWAGYGLTAAGLLAYAGGAWYAFRHRRPGPLDFSVRFAITAGGLMILPVLLFPWVGRQAQAGLVMFFALAFIGGTILGMLMRIIPFMVWLHRFRNRTHKLEKIPFLHEMSHPRWGWTGYVAWFPATVLVAVGLGVSSPVAIVAGAAVGLIALAALGWALAEVIRHIRPGTPALYPGKKV